MKKMTIMLIIIISISALNADVLYNLTLEEATTNFENSLKRKNTHFDGILQSTIEFSKEEYKVGDIIDLKIHFEINTYNNVSNLNFVITDYQNNWLYSVYRPRFENLTKDEYNMMQKEFILEDNICEYIESDPDLVLSNDHPKGTYNIKFVLNDKCNGISLFEKKYPFRKKILSMWSFRDLKKHELITEYFGTPQNFVIPIPIHPDALNKSNKSMQKIHKFPLNIETKSQINGIQSKKIPNEIQGDRTELRVLSGETTVMRFMPPRPHEIISYDAGLGTIAITN